MWDGLDRQMNLLFVESSLEGWGTEQHCAALAIAMAARDHRVLVLLSPGSAIEEPLRKANVRVETVKFGGGADPRLWHVLLALASKFKPDWYVTNDGKLYWPLVLLAKLTGARSAIFRHWTAIRRPLTRLLLPRLADRFILVSEAARQAFERMGVPEHCISVLYNPVDLSKYQPTAGSTRALRGVYGGREPNLVVGYVGRIVQEKGVFVLLDALEAVFDENPSVRMLWVGDGEGLPTLRRRIAESRHGARHCIQGWLPNIESVYPALDLLVVPSIYPEPFGRVSIEAQACGTPVICSAIGGLPETLSTGGVLVPPGDSAALTAHVLHLLESEEFRHRLAMAGRSFVTAHFSLEVIGATFEDLLQKRSVVALGKLSRAAP